MGSTVNGDIEKLVIPTFDFDQIKEGLAKDSFLVIDVREANEMVSPGRIPCTKHVPLNEVKAAFGELTEDEFEARYDFSRPQKSLKAAPIIITCRSGMRATKAAETMIGLGYPVAVYKGSMLDWTAKGGKVLSGCSFVSYEEVQKTLSDGKKTVIDVRRKDEFAKGRIPKTHNVPLSEVWTAFQMSPEDFRAKFGFAKPEANDPVLLYCLAGRRAQVAADKLALLGYNDVDVYKGSFEEWTERGGDVEKD